MINNIQAGLLCIGVTMDIFARIWELISAFFNGLVNTFDTTVTSMFGSSNKRQVDNYQSAVEEINALESPKNVRCFRFCSLS